MKHPFYSLLMWLAQPLLRRKLARRAVAEPGYGVAVEERFGHYSMPADSGRIWIHAVSLGETRAAAILLAELRRQVPGMRLLLTNGTATGRAEGVKLLQSGDVQVWQPWDTAGAVQRFLDYFKPAVGVLMETEIWPNLTQACAARGVPLALANARMNERSHARARRLGWLARPVFAALAAAWAQTRGDADRLRDLGAPVAGVFGNLKFDASPDAAQLNRGHEWRTALGRPVVLLASSREGEETVFLKEISALASASRTFSAIERGKSDEDTSVQWLIVPRHPQRFEAVAQLIIDAGFAVSRCSQWPDGPPAAGAADIGDGRPCIWLGDSMGEMALYYALADVALLGGSFEPLGGQNLIEAAACGCPVVMGPHTFNFAEAAALSMAAGAAREVPDMAAGLRAARQWLARPAERNAAVLAALAFSGANRGAAAKTAQAVQELLAAKRHESPLRP